MSNGIYLTFLLPSKSGKQLYHTTFRKIVKRKGRATKYYFKIIKFVLKLSYSY
jgi:hypothetical protein